MISNLCFMLLFWLCSPMLTGNSTRVGPDWGGLSIKQREHETNVCECMESPSLGPWVDVKMVRARQSGFEGSLCSCNSDLSFHQQTSATDKSLPTYFPAQLSRIHKFFGRVLLTSPEESLNNIEALCSVDSRHESPSSVALPPCGDRIAASLSSANTRILEIAISAAPKSQRSSPPMSKHNIPGHESLGPSIAPSASGHTPVSAPAYEHFLTSISPSPDCSAVDCLAPLTKSTFASQCFCVQPIEVKMQLSVPLYALFPYLSVLAEDLAKGVSLSSSQVQIVAANTSGQNDEFSVVDANLLPSGLEFSNMTVRSIAQKFWDHEIMINGTLFGEYTVLYVKYPDLAAPPPQTGVNGVPKPFGVNIVESKPNKKFGTKAIVAVAVCAGTVIILCSLLLWVLRHSLVGTATIFMLRLGFTKSKIRGGRSLLSSDQFSFASFSFPSSVGPNTARLFTIAELNRATNEFAPQNILGEGGFGRVFCGVLDDGTDVAVKVLTRENHHGGKEFITEVEILSRLHHRNLVKLIGICSEEHVRCLVYELVSNGSVDSHLHGKRTSSLDWETRMKIVLGAARGLAYLHEDSSPCIIHRDFKTANILLDNDFNPKVSDFGLAKVAPDSGKDHHSTKVMGTFGYVAPEYAMTGHLLVKSDVYSYGVVLLEILSGRKPVDFSRPLGQENLVTWARPLLTSLEGLEVLVDPRLKDSVPYDSLAKVAAIASMCVHPEVSDRPSMGEVVQALKLVCNEFDLETKMNSSRNPQETGDKVDTNLQSGERSLDKGTIEHIIPSVAIGCESGSSQDGLQRSFSPSALFCNSTRYTALPKTL
ncbi:hypothetical protein KP509_09G007400 [Ceratopteris richardii]|uniref:Protein kinase domain-containing protein n=1 Tax=Ceratopteris richardii TaxID=49495 RepID=A0A8T2U4L9_CERRI|nr:hypothetical protein KP509_09G007400 [Ceratopteris richardii]KAH7428575.1 hypothetical protein KP509_09G007400 [Ceratopteris richardii]